MTPLLGFAAALALGLLTPVGAAATAPDLRAHASLSKRSVYAGEEIVYTARLLSAVPLHAVDFRPPPFTGLTARRLPGAAASEVTLEGRSYQTLEVAYLLAPRRAGRLALAPATFACLVEAGDASAGPDPFFERAARETRDVETPPVSVAVRALPPYRGPGAFSGLIGRFGLSVHLEPDRVAAGQPAALRVILSGRGRPAGSAGSAGSAAPDVLAPDGVRIHPEGATDEEVAGPAGTSLRQVFGFAVIPERPGPHSLGPFGLVTFDPARGAYARLTAGPLTLEATGTAAVRGAPPAVPSAPLPLDRPSGGSRSALLASQAPLALRRFLALLVLPAAFHAFVRALTQGRSRSREPVPRLARSARRLGKEAARAALRGDASTAADLGYRSLVSAIRAVAGRPGGSLTHAEVETLLATVADTSRREAAASLFDRLEAARFGVGPTDPGRADAAVQAERAVRALTRPVAVRPLGAIAWGLVCALCLATAGLPDSSRPSGYAARVLGAAIDDGSRSLARRDFVASAAAFSVAVRGGLRNPALFTALADGYRGQGETGRAALWRARALWLGGAAPEVGGAGAPEARDGSGPLEVVARATRRPGVRGIQVAAVALNASFWGLLALVRTGSRRTRAAPLVGALALAFASTALLHAWQGAFSREAIILPAEVVVRSGIHDDTAELLRLSGGERVQVDRRLADRFCIARNGDRLGWVPAEAVALVREDDVP